MRIILVQLFLGISLQACLPAEQLIKENESPVNFKPGSSQTVCWGCNDRDMERFLGLSYDHYVMNDLTLSVEECDTMFTAKLKEATEYAERLFVDGTQKLCDCAVAAMIDIIYDISPLIFYDNELWIDDMKTQTYYMAD